MGDSLTRPGSEQEKREGKRENSEPGGVVPDGGQGVTQPNAHAERQISFTIPARDSFVFLTSTSIAVIPMSGSTLAPSRIGANE